MTIGVDHVVFEGDLQLKIFVAFDQVLSLERISCCIRALIFDEQITGIVFRSNLDRIKMILDVICYRQVIVKLHPLVFFEGLEHLLKIKHKTVITINFAGLRLYCLFIFF